MPSQCKTFNHRARQEKGAISSALVCELEDILPPMYSFAPGDDGISIVLKSAVAYVKQQCKDSQHLEGDCRLEPGSPTSTEECSLQWPMEKCEKANWSAGFEVPSSDVLQHSIVGDGSHCVVFEGQIISRNQRVAVRRVRSSFDPANKPALVRDFRSLACSLRHPSIVECVGVSLCDSDRSVLLLCEWMGGATLEDHYQTLHDHAVTAPFLAIVRWSLQLFRGLAFLHALRPAPVIVRDLKPSALLLSADRRHLKIRDFGLHKTADLGTRCSAYADNMHPHLTLDLARLHGPTNKCFSDTARYLAPEIELQPRRGAGYSGAADVYSAGLVMWFMLAGERPWEGLHGHRARAAAQRGLRPPLVFTRTADREAAGELGEVIAYCWDSDAEDRPRAEQVAGCLEMLQARHGGDSDDSEESELE